MKTRLFIAIAMVGLMHWTPAHSHAMLDRSVPSVGGTVHGAPAKVELWFSEDLEPVFSTVKVVDKTGRQVDKGDHAVDGRDPRRLAVSLPPLPPGTYRVVWRAISVDAHATQGDFTFDLAP